MTRTRSITLAAALLALVLPLPIAAAGTAFAAPATAPAVSSPAITAPAQQLQLPRPTGQYAVGTDDLHLVDRQRQDPWVPSAGPRQLMVSMYYPAVHGTGRPAPYMTTAAAQDFIDFEVPGSALSATALAATRTYAYADARPEHGRFPLVVLSPGMEQPRAMLTGLAVDLASRGYVVAVVDHTYENTGTTFPDGTTLGCTICNQPVPGGPAAIVDSRAKDLAFTIGQLTESHSPWPHADLIDRSRIAVAGHSVGGAAALATMAVDPRVRAGADLDGTLFTPVPASGLAGRSFLLFGTQIDHNVGGSDSTWGDTYAALDGWKEWLTVAGTVHASFTDIPILATEGGIPLPPQMQTSAQRGMQLTRDYVAAYFDQQLKGRPQPLLTGPNPADPEVAFQHP
ncbi:dienelactone hydrolase [Kitasatospora sp. MAA4]|uniref:alpha/beta hydrolase family protein n=1 Tax=Kitasatospora sp. MAA4 TaxID=3035093 RepID=UPI0024745ABA|nr:alpha/beta hydrolase [Kitasatospora sp. MAA4]MDH6135703.1 dienelactone hydrolase [Kitasatospora sp. MAA4]